MVRDKEQSDDNLVGTAAADYLEMNLKDFPMAFARASKQTQQENIIFPALDMPGRCIFLRRHILKLLLLCCFPSKFHHF